MVRQQPVPVVAAVISDAAGRMLLAQRPPHKHLALRWEFPGGKVEPGESPAAALARELREELGITIADLQPLPPFTHDYGSVVIAMLPFRCRLAADSPAPHAHEHVALAWTDPAGLSAFDLAPADLPIVAAVLPPGVSPIK